MSHHHGGLVVRVGSIPGHDRRKSLKLVVVAFPLGTQDYGNSTMTGLPVAG